MALHSPPIFSFLIWHTGAGCYFLQFLSDCIKDVFGTSDVPVLALCTYVVVTWPKSVYGVCVCVIEIQILFIQYMLILSFCWLVSMFVYVLFKRSHNFFYNVKKVCACRINSKC